MFKGRTFLSLYRIPILLDILFEILFDIQKSIMLLVGAAGIALGAIISKLNF